MDSTRKIAEFVANTSYDALPGEALATAKTAFIDCVGVMLAGSQETSAQICSQMAEQEWAKGDATIFGRGFKSSAMMAAFANGTSGHALDFDHGFYLMGQPTSALIPASLSVGESLGASGRDLLEAYAAGFEVTARLAISTPELSGKGGWHSTGILGALGAAVCCGKLFRLEAREIQMAVGLAASMASGISANFGTMTKPLHAGLAARNGVLAAKMARAGYTAGAEPLESSMGFYHTYGRGLPIAPEALDRLGKSWALAEHGIKIKPYPCGGLTHPAIDAVLELRAEHALAPETIESIVVGVPQHTFDRIVFKVPATGLQGKFSMGYLLARALIEGKVSLDAFTDEAVRDRRVLELASKVEMKLDPKLDNSPEGGRPCAVEMRLTDSRTFSRRADYAKGGREQPLSREELHGKYLECATRVIRKEAAEKVLQSLDRLEEVNDIRPLCDLLSGRDRP